MTPLPRAAAETLTSASSCRCPGARQRWGPAPSKRGERPRQSVGRSVGPTAPPRPAPTHRRRLPGEGARGAIEAVLAQEREHEGEQVTGHRSPLRHAALRHVPPARTRTAPRTQVRTCVRAHAHGLSSALPAVWGGPGAWQRPPGGTRRAQPSYRRDGAGKGPAQCGARGWVKATSRAAGPLVVQREGEGGNPGQPPQGDSGARM